MYHERDLSNILDSYMIAEEAVDKREAVIIGGASIAAIVGSIIGLKYLKKQDAKFVISTIMGILGCVGGASAICGALLPEKK